MPDPRRVTLCSGEEVEIYEGDNRKDIQEISNWSKQGFMKPVNGKWIIPKNYINIDEKLYNFKFRSSDVFVNGFPKSGTTWVQEIVWNILYNLDLTHPLTKEHSLIKVPFFEGDSMRGMAGIDEFTEIASKVHNIPIKPTFAEMYSHIQDPRIFKTHMYSSIMNIQLLDISKMVYVVRDPMDSCYSYYLYHRYMSGAMGLNKEWDEYTDIYIRGEVFAGNAVEHLRSWWPYRGNKGFYMIFYEDILRNPAAEIKNLAKFLEKDITEEQLQNVIHQSSFKIMKSNFRKSDDEMAEAVGVTVTDEQSGFFRKGVVGDSKNMPKGSYEKFSEFFKKSLKDYDLPYNKPDK